MEFKNYLMEQVNLHPSIQPQDIVKLCYQAARGGEHLLQDTMGAAEYFLREFDSMEPEKGPLFECISPDICRVDLRAWKNTGLPSEWLFRMFAGTTTFASGGEERFLECIQTVEQNLDRLPFSRADWQAYWEYYKAAGMPSVHHSVKYHQAEKPAYRIVNRQYLRLLPILERAAELKSGIIVIDGRAASGKTTMAGQLQKILGAELIRMDDFFLPPVLRTVERFAQPGGNVHYERFIEEVLPCLKAQEPFSYRRFDCGKMDYNGEKYVSAASWWVVEGSYSSHPLFGSYGDITVFSDVDPEEQTARILIRNGAEMAEMFREKWIPLEERYFETYQVREKAAIRV